MAVRVTNVLGMTEARGGRRRGSGAINPGSERSGHTQSADDVILNAVEQSSGDFVTASTARCL